MLRSSELRRPVRVPAPRTRRLRNMYREFCFDLPFDNQFESLAYIGLVSHETWHVESHYHDHFELCYVDEGHGWFDIDGSKSKVRKGDLFLTKPGEGHSGAADSHTPFRLYYIGFRFDEVRNLENGYYQIGLHRVVNDSERLVKSLLEKVLQEVRGNHIHRVQMVQGMFIQLIVTVLRLYDSQAQERTSISPMLNEALALLHSQTKYQHTNDLANSLHISRTHLSREFKQHMGVPIGHYIRDLCIQRAKHYLDQSSEGIAGIAEILGFSSVNTFSMFFKRHVGISPRDYRHRRDGYTTNLP